MRISTMCDSVKNALNGGIPSLTFLILIKRFLQPIFLAQWTYKMKCGLFLLMMGLKSVFL
jgi:hypothetical protein